MKKINFIFCCFLICCFCGIERVVASDDGVFAITDEVTFDQCLKMESVCRLMADMILSSSKDVTTDLVIDLNGHALVADPSFQLKSGLISVGRGGKLTINDSKGTGKISTGPDGNVWAAVMMLRNGSGNELAELVVNGGTIEGYYYGIVGNGNNHNTKITINGGTIQGLNKEDSAGIYQPQRGELIIQNGTIIGGTGIEIRSGDLTIHNGTVKAIASNFVKMVNGNGTTTNGVGVAVAQHTTKNPIHVLISGGTISGQYAFYEWNPHNNNQDALNQINLAISGGDFTGLATGVHAVYSQDFTGFISGGKFNTDVTEYLSADSNVTSIVEEDSVSTFQQAKNKKSGGFILFLIGLGSCGCGFLVWNKRKVIFR